MTETLPFAATWTTLAAFLAATLSAGSTGVLFQPGAWYRGLRKPSWTPPNWLFPIAWTALYIAMAVAAWRVAGTAAPFPALAVWSWQIVLNAAWSPIVFGLHRLRAGLVVIGALWVAVALATLLFWRQDTLAGALMLLYLVWVSYATALNAALVRRNGA